MINFLNYMAVSVCLTSFHSKYYRKTFDFTLCIALFVVLYSINNNVYTLLIGGVTMFTYGLIRKIGKPFHALCFALDSVVLTLYCIALFSIILVIIGFSYVDNAYQYAMIVLMALVGAIYFLVIKKENTEQIPFKITLLKMVLKIMGISVYLHLIPSINRLLGNDEFYNTAFNLIFVFIVTALAIITKNIIRLSVENECLKELSATYNVLQDVYKEILVTKHLFADLAASELSENNDIKNVISMLEHDMNEKTFPLDFIIETQKIKIDEISSLLCFYYSRCRANSIMLHVFVADEITKISITTSDLIKILLSYLGNAVKFAKESDKQLINIYFSHGEGRLLIVIENSLKTADYFINRKGSGMEIVNDIVKKHGNITKNTYVRLDMFIQEITIR